MKQIMIRGASGVGKSIYVERLENAALKAGYTVAISDHELFTSLKTFEKDLKKTLANHSRAGVDISIVVINNGERNLQITYEKGLSYELARFLIS